MTSTPQRRRTDRTKSRRDRSVLLVLVVLAMIAGYSVWERGQRQESERIISCTIVGILDLSAARAEAAGEQPPPELKGAADLLRSRAGNECPPLVVGASTDPPPTVRPSGETAP